MRLSTVLQVRQELHFPRFGKETSPQGFCWHYDLLFSNAAGGITETKIWLMLWNQSGYIKSYSSLWWKTATYLGLLLHHMNSQKIGSFFFPFIPDSVVHSPSWRYLHQIADWRNMTIKCLHHKSSVQDSFSSPQHFISTSSPPSSFPSPFPIFFPRRLDFKLPQSSSPSSFLLKYFSNLYLLLCYYRNQGMPSAFCWECQLNIKLISYFV